ncbi:MBOAT family O-acyltransferase [Brumimicrobium mesophilum]|uniref:MBOAT family O-acyltransferase n=1 Tax=Brumimicrobium mesophilum TaxID=392717 RepID=UPI000D143BE2|nr:MBOAT family O-acyltransferase [Brumimicrobium mesophilum]
MLFNSLDFAIFLPIVFILYWFVTNNNLRLQNLLIVVSSYVFYGWWDWRFLSLIIFSTLIDYLIGRKLIIEERIPQRKLLLWISIIVNLGFLGFFKYYNFFVDNFITAFSLFGTEIKANTLNIILPVGISFYTFQTLSYTIDVYKRKLEPTKDFIAFSAFVSFFPQLVAGPIERATNLLPQFYIKRIFNSSFALEGIRQIMWGLLKKMVIADNCAVIANSVFSNYNDVSASTLFFGAIMFTFQIYGDFSGYSDIAIGTGKLFGFDLKKNFAYPYLSRDIAEFWRRWHISLSTWFRDYVYIPLGGSRDGKNKAFRNTIIIFLVSGFWHGANWTFIVWGAYHAILFLPLVLLNKNRKFLTPVAENKTFPTLKELMQILCTFLLVVIGWIIFRSESINDAYMYISRMFSSSILSIPTFVGPNNTTAMISLFYILIMILFEWKYRKDHFVFESSKSQVSMMFSTIFIVVSIYYFSGSSSDFIYFQF